MTRFSHRLTSRNWRTGVGIAIFAAAAWSIGPSMASGLAVQDASGRTVTVNDPSRIVAIGGSITEILYALGLDGRVIAVDTTSLHPPRALREKPNVGYMRALSPEGVLGLNPSLILALDGAGPKETIAVLDAARVPFVRVPEAFTAAGILAKIKLVAAAAGAPERGACLAAAIERDLERLAKLRSDIAAKKRVMFVLSLANGRPMVAGRNTAADGIIRLAGGINAIDDFDNYKPVSDEAVIGTKPDTILAMQRAGATLEAATVFALPAFGLTPAAKSNAFVSMEGLYLLGFGPRTAQAARDLALALYPSLAREELPSEHEDPGARCRQ
jgi:iron complex transport system substrate-binding protein